MNDQQQQRNGQQQQVSLSDFLLTQRRTMDQIVTSYENNMGQFAQRIEELTKQVQELGGTVEPQVTPPTSPAASGTES